MSWRCYVALQALSIYKELLAQADPDPVLYIYAAACLYYMGSYNEAMDMADQASITHRHSSMQLLDCFLLQITTQKHKEHTVQSHCFECDSL